MQRKCNFDGGAGTNAAIFHGSRSEYSIALVTGSDNLQHVEVINDGTTGDATLNLVNVQNLEFAGGTTVGVSSLVVGGPVVTPASTNINSYYDQHFAASSLFTATDPNGNAITEYDVRDSGTGGGHFDLNGVALLTLDQDHFISAAQLSELSYEAGAGTDTLQISAADGALWGATADFTVTTSVDAGPTVTADKTALLAYTGQSLSASSLFAYSDQFGLSATEYEFYFAGTGGGHLVSGANAANGGKPPQAGQNYFISSSDLSELSYQVGSGNDTLWVRATDGISWGAWSSPFFIAGTPDTPNVSVANLTAAHGQSFAASSLFAASDPLGTTITEYDFYDTASGGAHLVFNTANGPNVANSANSPQPNQDYFINANQLSELSYQSGSGTDTLWVRASNGTTWGTWSSALTVTAPIDGGPIVTPTTANTSSFANQTLSAASLFRYSDPFGSAATEYDFYYEGTGGGHLVSDGPNTANGGQPPQAGHDYFVNASELSELSYQVGSGTDTLWVRANDGTVWGSWSAPFTISDPPAIAGGQTITLGSAYDGVVNFLADTGTLKLENSSSFAGTVAGLHGQDAVDFTDISFSSATLDYNTSSVGSGALAIGDGTHSASIALLGNYIASSFVTTNDGQGGTLISESAQSTIPATVIAQAHA